MPRSKPSVAIATFQPSPTGPSTFSLAVRALVEEHLVELGAARSSGAAAAPRCPAGPSGTGDTRGRGATIDSGSVRHTTKHQSARCASVVHTFWPVITHSSPSSTARVWMLARSEPAFGSEKPWHHSSSTDWIFGRNRRFCSSVPNWISVGREQPLAEERDPRRRVRPRVLLVEDHLLRERRAPGRRTPRATTCRPSGRRRAPAPTRSGRPSRSRRPARRPSPSAANSPVRCSASHARTSARKAASSGVSRKSMRAGRYLTDRSGFQAGGQRSLRALVVSRSTVRRAPPLGRSLLARCAPTCPLGPPASSPRPLHCAASSPPSGRSPAPPVAALTAP